MKPLLRALVLCLLFSASPLALARERLFVLTDISNEPDDEESLVRLLVYSNEMEIEGLVATTSTWLRQGTREDLIRRQIDAYSKVLPNLTKHAKGYPDPGRLLAVTTTGQPGYGMAHVGAGKSTAGSRLLLAAADRDDQRPLWVSVWGGANTLAQALDDARRERSGEDLDRLVSRLRVYTISDQDDAGAWLRREFPGLFYIVSPSTTRHEEYHRATWTGISGDRHYRNGPMHRFELVDNPWLEANIIRNHGALGALYPRQAYIMEGDTPAFLGLIDNGLRWAESPGYGGWGGRYVLFQNYGETRKIWTNNADSRDTVVAVSGERVCSDQATIWRWREDFQHDFAARMDWCVAEEYGQANHNPVAVLNGDRTRGVVKIRAVAGDELVLSASGSSDPDGNPFEMTWFVYPEAGTLRSEVNLSHHNGETTALRIPDNLRIRSDAPQTLHVILTVRDQGEPSLVAYRRAIIEVAGP